MQSTQLSSRDVSPESWNEFLKDFSKRNENKPTRLEAVGFEVGAQVLEKSLPLVGVSYEPKGSEAGSVEIILGGDSPADGASGSPHNAITPLTGITASRDGLWIRKQRTVRGTLLIFEELPNDVRLIVRRE
jgi:hypothetical protein